MPHYMNSSIDLLLKWHFWTSKVWRHFKYGGRFFLNAQTISTDSADFWLSYS